MEPHRRLRPSAVVQSKLDTCLLTIATRDWPIFVPLTYQNPSVPWVGNEQLQQTQRQQQMLPFEPLSAVSSLLQALDQSEISPSVVTNIVYWNFEMHTLHSLG